MAHRVRCRCHFFSDWKGVCRCQDTVRHWPVDPSSTLTSAPDKTPKTPGISSKSQSRGTHRQMKSLNTVRHFRRSHRAHSPQRDNTLSRIPFPTGKVSQRKAAARLEGGSASLARKKKKQEGKQYTQDESIPFRDETITSTPFDPTTGGVIVTPSDREREGYPPTALRPDPSL